jgi:hypothetical protein
MTPYQKEFAVVTMRVSFGPYTSYYLTGVMLRNVVI